jgi:hypothetical protein
MANRNLIREALAKVRKVKRNKEGKLANRALAGRVSEMLRWMRMAKHPKLHKDSDRAEKWKQAEHHAKQIIDGKY